MRLQLSSDHQPAEVQTLLGASPPTLAAYQDLLLQQSADGILHQGIPVTDARELCEYFKTESDLAPLDPDRRLYLTAAYLQLDDWEGAVRASTDAIDLYAGGDGATRPHESAAAYLIRGYAYASASSRHKDAERRSHNLTKALVDFREAINLNADYAPSHFYLGALYSALEQFGEAESSYKRALGIKPDYADAYNDLGVLYLGLNEHKAALEVFQRAVDLDEENEIYLKNLAQAYMRLERWRDAQLVLQKALTLGHEDAGAYNDLGLVYIKQENLKQAEEAFLTAIRLKPDYAIAYENLGGLYYMMQRTAEAELAFRKSLELAPSGAEARDALRILGAQHPAIPLKEAEVRHRSLDMDQRTTDAMRLQRAEEVARKMQDDMMILTHQLQGPLYSAIGALSFIKFKSEDASLKERLSYVESLLEDEVNVCFGVFTAFSVEQGRAASLAPETINASEELRSLVKRIQATNARQDLTFVYKVDADLPALRMDKSVFTSAFYSLIHNTMKYADAHSQVVLECLFERPAERFVLKVKSYGEPIGLSESEEIFGKFARGRNIQMTGRHHSGVGLGLWVARELMRSVGGDLSVELSAFDPRLSTFIVHVPKFGAT
jgi:tetratricopeptide (TPR) repeat protein